MSVEIIIETRQLLCQKKLTFEINHLTNVVEIHSSHGCGTDLHSVEKMY